MVTGGEQSPPGFTGMAGSQTQAHPVVELFDPAAELDQAQPKRGERHPRDMRGLQPAAQSVEEPVGRDVEQQPELVGPKPVTGATRRDPRR